MSRLESAATIEAKVGVERHPVFHWARAVSAEQRVYVLHSAKCRDSGIDLRDCEFSVALDRGIEAAVPRAGWAGQYDRPVVLCIFRGYLIPSSMSEAAAAADLHERVTVDAYDLECSFGDCEHDGDCPSSPLEVCLACSTWVEDTEVYTPWSDAEQANHRPEGGDH
ncbi:hypothetical protein GCM10022239_03540 [Leifsonia bigeumensis]|uniref:Uncharacterized protein n=1 Tax=Leifsonella bigeumensis TaxID=433643 RepID=A0ABP7F832_9MICO